MHKEQSTHAQRTINSSTKNDQLMHKERSTHQIVSQCATGARAVRSDWGSRSACSSLIQGRLNESI